MPAAPPFSSHRRAESRVGTTLLKWKIDALLGVGGMASVYSAVHHNRSRVALKVLHRELAAIPELRQRFLHEAYVANSVGHDGAVQVVDDHVTEDGEPFLVMQLLEGQPLDALQAARGVLSPEEVLDCAEQVLDVLAAAHARAIVHRDIKPQNLFWTKSGAIKVLDFGVGRIFDGAPSLTATGVLIGTPAFMPPEQAGGRNADIGPTSDLWSLGATMFTLLSGRFVHEADNAQAHTVKAAVQPPRSLRTLRPDLPDAVVKLVDRALAFELKDRWPSALEMQFEVRRVRASLAASRASLPSLPDHDASARASHPALSSPGAMAGTPAAALQGAATDSDLATPPMRAPEGRPSFMGNPPAAPGNPPPSFGLSAAPVIAGPPAAMASTGPHPAALNVGSPSAMASTGPHPAALNVGSLSAIAPPAALPRLTPLQMGLIFGGAFAAVVALMLVLRVALAPAGSGASGSGAPEVSGALTARSSSRPVSSNAASEPQAPQPLLPATASARPGELNPAEAHAALEAAEVEAKKCGTRFGPKGRTSVDVTFYPDGGLDARIELRFNGTAVGQCVEDAFRNRGHVTPFKGRPVATTRMVVVGE